LGRGHSRREDRHPGGRCGTEKRPAGHTRLRSRHRSDPSNRQHHHKRRTCQSSHAHPPFRDCGNSATEQWYDRSRSGFMGRPPIQRNTPIFTSFASRRRSRQRKTGGV